MNLPLHLFRFHLQDDQSEHRRNQFRMFRTDPGKYEPIHIVSHIRSCQITAATTASATAPFTAAAAVAVLGGHFGFEVKVDVDVSLFADMPWYVPEEEGVY